MTLSSRWNPCDPVVESSTGLPLVIRKSSESVQMLHHNSNPTDSQVQGSLTEPI